MAEPRLPRDLIGFFGGRPKVTVGSLGFGCGRREECCAFCQASRQLMMPSWGPKGGAAFELRLSWVPQIKCKMCGSIIHYEFD